MTGAGHGARKTYYSWSDDCGERWTPKRDLIDTLLPLDTDIDADTGTATEADADTDTDTDADTDTHIDARY